MKKIKTMQELEELLKNNRVEHSYTHNVYWTAKSIIVDISRMIINNKLDNKEISDSTYILNVFKIEKVKTYRDVMEAEEMIENFTSLFDSVYHIDGDIDLYEKIIELVEGKMYTLSDKRVIVEQYDCKDLYNKIVGDLNEKNN